MKKSVKKQAATQSSKSFDNSFGIASVVFGVLSIIFASLNGIILGIIALVFATKQQNKSPNSWGKSGKILAIIGLILSVIAIIIAAYYLPSALAGFPPIA